MKFLSIGQVAKQTGLGIETVRYYEREGLLDAPQRKESGYRQYGEDVIDRLRFIKRAKELGFSLREIKELLALRVDPQTTCADMKQRAESKLTDIEEKIRMLQGMKKALVKLTRTCPGSGPTSECPILDALDE